jgi:lysozyme
MEKTVFVPDWTPGIDVSHYQGVIDWAQVASAGIKFAYIKATDGVVHVDPYFHRNWEGAKSAGIYRGAYHFFRPEFNEISQLALFIRTVGPLIDLPLLLPCALDLEVGPMDQAELDNAFKFLKALDAAKPVLYVDKSTGEKIKEERFAQFSLWLADYSTIEPMSWTFWQHTPQGQVGGIQNAVDLNWFNGPFEELEKLA